MHHFDDQGSSQLAVEVEVEVEEVEEVELVEVS